MWQILHASFWKFSKLSNSGTSLNRSVIDEVTTRNTTAYFLDHCVKSMSIKPGLKQTFARSHQSKTSTFHCHIQIAVYLQQALL